MNKTFYQFKLNEDLFYTIYDYLRFEKPEKWKDIHSIDDFDYLLVDEMKDLATDAVDWLENDLYGKVNIWDKNAGAPREWPTLYYMTLAFINEFDYHVSLRGMSLGELQYFCNMTINWLRENINKI